MIKKWKSLSQDNQVKLFIVILVAVFGVVGYFGKTWFNTPIRIVTPSNSESDRINLESVRKIQESIPNRQIDLKIWLKPNRKNFIEGERFKINVTADQESYIAVFVHSNDGSTSVIYPNKFKKTTKIDRNQVFTVGNANDEFELEVGPPFGLDIIQVIATTSDAQLNQLIKNAKPLQGTEYNLVVRDEIKKGVIPVYSLNSKTGVGDLSLSWGESQVTIYTKSN